MKPEKPDNAIVDLLDELLDDGAIVQADVLLTVADVPLVGIKLRAAIAGMATMEEYGMFADWDRAIRGRAREEPKVRRPGLERTGWRASRERRHLPSRDDSYDSDGE